MSENAKIGGTKMPMDDRTFQTIRGHLIERNYAEAVRLVTRDAENHSERMEALRIAASLANAWEASRNRELVENPSKLTEALKAALDAIEVRSATLTISDPPPVGGVEEG